MALSWNEIKDRAIRFSKEWESELSEKAEAKTFWDQFFDVFGISRRKIGSFERPVHRLDESTGYIDFLWKGTILVEHKSRGKDLDKAYKQALDYFPGLADYELPKYVLVSDFARFRLYNLEEATQLEFELKDLYKNVKEFAFIAGYQKHVFKEQDPVNIQAAELMGKLHDRLKAVGYTGHPLELYLVRLLFCLFAEDTSIFERDQFRDYIENKTKADGSDLAQYLSMLFYVLNTPADKRLSNLDEDLNAFPYVNGKLFEETLAPASFDTAMRAILFESTALDWGKISPAIFGSLFQSVMNPVERRNLGAHYTSEKNILKVIKPLFLDDLWKEYEAVKSSRIQLIRFHDKLASLRYLDPACGCGNFLVISYRELRLLEIEIIKTLQKGQQVFDIHELLKLDVDRFYGIEIEEFPSQIAQVAMWLMDHQMNMRASEEFGQYFLRLPLRKSPNIHCGNALRMDWQSLLDQLPWDKKEQRFDYIYGNPPFVGNSLMNPAQKADMEVVFSGVHGAGVLDFVTAWYIRAAKYLSLPHDPDFQPTQTRCAFVSTNSIAQGEQVGVLWNELFNKYYIKIHFAHRTFKWSNEARGKAAVHVVIIGFSNFDIREKRIFEYQDIAGEPHEIIVRNINPYLVEGKDFVLSSRTKPYSNIPPMSRGNSPYDNGYLLLTEYEKENFIEAEPQALKYVKRFLSAKEFLNQINRYCIWLVDANPAEIRSLPLLEERIRKVKIFRENSPGVETRKYATTPALFRDRNNPDTFVLIPRHSSEKRRYIPIGFFDKSFIPGDSCMFIPNTTFYQFGVLTSAMHMSWVKYVCGRLKSDYRYSASIVYNNFPWPENLSEKQKKDVEDAAQKVLDVREKFLNPTENSPSHDLTISLSKKASLADLYDPLTMPPALVKAHQALDKAVDLCYRPQPFPNETKRIEFLFELYDKYTADLFTKEKPGKKRKT
ncbi:MAG: class I SAM-dependent DNA methyltransferase [Bacteroidetes bacterium]|nr:class I SAM-dependent DNA methyltransferase [Bacteroidota bacterium]